MTLTDIIAKITLFAKRVIVTDNSSNVAVSITQSGSGTAVTVNQSGSGEAIRSVNGDNSIERYSNTLTDRPRLNLEKFKGTESSPQIVGLEDRLGTIDFNGYDGSASQRSATIAALIDGTPSSTSMPGRLVLGTSGVGSVTPSSRIVIKASGNVGIGNDTPSSRLHVDGDVTVSSATTSTTANAGAQTLPANPVGFIVVSINGTSRKIPYYAT